MIDLIGTSISVLSLFGIYGLLSLSLNLEYGFGGQFNLGQVFFFAIGSFSGALVTSYGMKFALNSSFGICTPEATQLRIQAAQTDPGLTLGLFGISLVVGGVIAAGAGYLFSYPALRIKEEFYLGLTLLVAAEIFRIVMRNVSLACGYFGLPGINNPFSWFSNANSMGLAYLGIIILLLLGTLVYVNRLTNSPFGRVLKALRDDDTAALVLGKPVQNVRGQVMLIGSFLAGIAGVLYGFYVGFVTPDDFIPTITFNVWLMILLGGKGNNLGALVGAAAVTLITRITIAIPLVINTSIRSADLAYLGPILLGVLMLVILVFRQKGLVPERPLKTKSSEMERRNKKKIEDS